jgi:DNA processing protein
MIHSHGAQSTYYQIIKNKFDYYRKISPGLINRLLNTKLELLQKEIEESKSDLITPLDSDWPKGLNDLDSPPIALLIKGRRQTLNGLSISISIVGSRKPTSYGHQIAAYLSREAASSGLVVVSGGAVGIDTAAHIGAIAMKGSSICVQAGGLNNLYPKENKKLFEEIIRNGLLVSEVMPNTPSKPFRFLIRNRLIAALSKATVVVEAEHVSGSIRTARDAAEIFRPVFAIPGEVTSALSQGCHRLIAERVADIATSFEEILEVITPLQLR